MDFTWENIIYRSSTNLGLRHNTDIDLSVFID